MTKDHRILVTSAFATTLLLSTLLAGCLGGGGLNPAGEYEPNVGDTVTHSVRNMRTGQVWTEWETVDAVERLVVGDQLVDAWRIKTSDTANGREEVSMVMWVDRDDALLRMDVDGLLIKYEPPCEEPVRSLVVGKRVDHFCPFTFEMDNASYYGTMSISGSITDEDTISVSAGDFKAYRVGMTVTLNFGVFQIAQSSSLWMTDQICGGVLVKGIFFEPEEGDKEYELVQYRC